MYRSSKKLGERVVPRRALAALALTVGVCLLPGCGKPAVEAPEVVRPVKIQIVGDTAMVGRREYPGTVRATQNAEMAFEVQGKITEFLVKEGDIVVEGDVLARLDDRDYQAQLKAAQADLRKAQSDLNRSLSIFKQDPGAISKQTIDSDRKGVEVAQARVEVSEKAVEDTVLVAPFPGRMARKLVEDFQNVQAKQPVLILQDNSTLEVEVSVPERDVVRGQSERPPDEMNRRLDPVVIISALPDRRFPARIKEFATVADPVTRTFPARLYFDNPPDVTILPGMTARVQVTMDRDRAWSLPVTALQADDTGKPFVWKVDPQTMTVSPVEVVPGDMAGDLVRIESGLEEGDQVAISGVALLREGMKVRRYES